MVNSTPYANPHVGSTVTLQIRTTNTRGLCIMKYAAKGQRHVLFPIDYNYVVYVNITFKLLMYLHISKTEILQTLRRAKISCLFWRKIRHTKCYMLLKEVSNYKRLPTKRP
jgi:hypothetical protein